jgi:hypothetical protein
MHFATFAAISKRFEAWMDRHWPIISAVGYTVSFVLLFGGVALHANQSGLAHALGERCGPVCLAIPGWEYAAGAMFGGAAILFTKLYAELAPSVQRVFIDPLVHVRPGSAKHGEVVGWAAALYVLTGIALFFVMAFFGKEQIPGRFEARIGGRSVFELYFGWGCGGRAVLEFFWPRPRRGLYTRPFR